MSRLLALCLLLSGWVAAAAAQDDLPWAGVYRGTIGRYPVVACFDRWPGGKGKGAYYYLSQLRPIALRGPDPFTDWREGDDAKGPEWRLDRSDGIRVSGTWHDGVRRLPIALSRVADGGEGFSPCAADAFIAPRVGKIDFTRTRQGLGSFAFDRLTMVAPRAFPDVSIVGMDFVSTEPGDEAIRALLGAMMPQGEVSDEYVQCMAGSLGSLGIDGDYSREVIPSFANRELLGVWSTNGSFCGGAHPSYWTEYFVFDRQSGARLDPRLWFGPDGFADDGYGSLLIQPALRDLVMTHWPHDPDGDSECRDFVSDFEYWSVGIDPDGLGFQPDVPHVATACGEYVTVGWDELAPFLNAAGKAIRARAER